MVSHPSLPGETASPPRPRLTLRVGVTGHRFDKLDAGRLEQLAATLAVLMQQVEQLCGEIRTRYAGVFDGEADLAGLFHAVRLVSGLAEGADQIAALARPAGWTLDAILPLPLPAYRETAASLSEDLTIWQARYGRKPLTYPA